MSLNQEYDTISRLYKARTNLLKQLAGVGYDVTKYTNFGINEVNQMFINKQQDMLVDHKTDGTKLYMNFHVEKGLRAQNVHDLIEDLYNLEEVLTKKDCLMIIAKDPANDTMKKLLQQLLAASDIYVNVISLSELQFCVLDHALVPPHTKLSAVEKQTVLDTYNIVSTASLPTISRFDPVAKMICMRPDDVCEIVRPSPTAVSSKYYRLCVNK